MNFSLISNLVHFFSFNLTKIISVEKLKNLAIIIPSYNEEKTVCTVVENINKHLESFVKINNFDIIVIDDGSIDETGKKVKDLNNTILLTHGFNRGIGAAVRTGLQFAENNNYDLVLKIDADLQHDVTDLDAVLEPILSGESDIVFGDRFSGSINYKMPKIRKLGNSFFTKLMSFVTEYNVRDSQPGIFAGNIKFLKSVSVFSDFNYTQQVLYSSYIAGLRFSQVPINFNERKYGSSFVKLSYPFKAIFQIILLMITKNPMKTFGFLSAIFLTISIGTTVYDLINYFSGLAPKPIMKVNLVLGTGLVGLQLLFTGVILKSISNVESYIRNRF